MPVAGAPGSSCRRWPGGAVSPASGGRRRAAGCRPRRLWLAEGRGLRTRASCRRLGSGGFPLARGAMLVWMTLRRRTFISVPHSPHKLLCSRSQGVARRVRGAVGAVEARAGWWVGQASSRRGPSLSGIQIGESAS